MPRSKDSTMRLHLHSILTFCLAIIFLGGLETEAWAQSKSPGVNYTVDLSDAKNHYLTITVDVPVKGKTTEMMMAVWTPGSYLVREYARHIDSIEVTSEGKKLDFEKSRKNRWLVQTEGIKSFQFKYRLYCNEMSVRTNWVGKQYAMINGAPTFVTVADRLGQKHAVQLTLPKGWKRSATSLRAEGDSPHSFVAENFDELVDSPIVAGNIHVYPFTAGGIEHQLVNVGESGYWDGTKAATDLKRVVESHQKMWGVIPYDRYLFINMIAETGGGLEHDNSTLIMTSRWSFREKSRYTSWLSLASHEFFHTWNVRRLRPKPLVKYDYENEVYTDGLWIAEGITSYYQDLALVRAGLISRSEYLTRISRDVESVQRTNGRKVQSLRESSYDTWIKFYRPDENSSNTRISYYSKGAVVAFLLDAKIRKLTNGEKSLDDVMQQMFENYSKSGFTSKQFRKTASEVAGKNLSAWFASVIDSTDELDYSDIAAIGVQVPNLKVEPTKPANKKSTDKAEKKPETETKKSKKQQRVEAKRKAAEKEASKKTESKKKSGDDGEKGEQADVAPKGETKPVAKKSAPKKNAPNVSVARPAPKPRPWLGFSTSSDEGKLTISSVRPESPASNVGLNIDDEVIAINGFRVSRSVDSRLSQYEVGDEIELLIARRGQLMTIRIEIGKLETLSWRLRYISKPSEEQKTQMDLWLGTAKN